MSVLICSLKPFITQTLYLFFYPPACHFSDGCNNEATEAPAQEGAPGPLRHSWVPRPSRQRPTQPWGEAGQQVDPVPVWQVTHHPGEVGPVCVRGEDPLGLLQMAQVSCCLKSQLMTSSWMFEWVALTLLFFKSVLGEKQWHDSVNIDWFSGRSIKGGAQGEGGGGQCPSLPLLSFGFDLILG